MSTEHQKYSTENQAERIARYAAERGFEIIRTYEDSGKSGLSLDGRRSLQQLLSDVRDRTADFDAILVYDISRWGRFQDADESAYYEFICREAGITVHYCAEQFENDGSISATIIKSVKRAMAGEYSRELSVKVFAGQCRLIRLGFRQGGPAGFGLRRTLVDENRNAKTDLQRGEHKSLQTDRVVLTLGPEDEVATVRSVYRAFLDEQLTEGEIATRLNAKGLQTDLGRPWSRGTVHQLLTNEKYIGNNVYHRTSFKLKRKHVQNPRDMWIRVEGAFPAVVTHEEFLRAQEIILSRAKRYSDDEMLDRLRELLAQHGKLSGLLIDETDNAPSSAAFRHRFGSLVRAYQLIGYAPDTDFSFIEVNRYLRQKHPEVVQEVVSQLTALGVHVARDPVSELLVLNDELMVSLVLSRCLRTPAGAARWMVRFEPSHRPDVTIVARMNETNDAIKDYYLFPALDQLALRIRLAENNTVLLDTYRFDDLGFFYALAERIPIEQVA